MPGLTRALAQLLTAAVVVTATAGCATSGDEPVATPVRVPGRATLGSLPPVPSEREPLPTPPTVATTTTTTEAPRVPITGPIGDEVLGNRVLLIGETALATTTPRQGGLACEVIPTFGWAVAVDAEPGRTLDFATEVLDARLDEEWDVVGFFFGSILDRGADEFVAQLAALVERVAPRPVILYTVAELDVEQVVLNDGIRELRRSHPDVVLVDWARASGEEPELLLVDGGPVPTEEGSGRIVLFTVAALGDAPVPAEEGECLPSPFDDDSAIVL
jgi:hypothetical protein